MDVGAACVLSLVCVLYGCAFRQGFTMANTCLNADVSVNWWLLLLLRMLGCSMFLVFCAQCHDDADEALLQSDVLSCRWTVCIYIVFVVGCMCMGIRNYQHLVRNEMH